MSLIVMATGRLAADPEVRVGSSGKPFTTARIFASTEDGDVVVSLLAFAAVGEQLAALGKGETITVTGRAKLASWTGRDGEPRTGLSMVVDALLTVHHARQRRRAMQGESGADG
jgi:single-stranded DNA-binding protein